MVVVFNDAEGTQALVTTITCKATGQLKGLIFSGPGKFTEKVRDHIAQTLSPVLAGLLAHLGLECPGFQISAVNLAAASWDHRGSEIAGYSADAPIFLAMLAAALGLELPEDLLCTGHIASPDGDIRMVGALVAKLAAASKEQAIKRFAYPDPMADGSLAPMLDPQEMQELHAALAAAKRSLSLYPLKDVADLVKVAFTREQLVLAGLRNGYFNVKEPVNQSNGPVERAAVHFWAGLTERFWSALETNLLAGQLDKSISLLHAFVDYHSARKKYPRGFGKRLMVLLASIPASTRRLKLKFPLSPSKLGFELAGFAPVEDHPDAIIMLKALNGDVGGANKSEASPQKDSSGHASVSNHALQNMITMINAGALAQKIGIPLDSARASYHLDSVLIDSHESFNDTVTSFVIHLLSRIRGIEADQPAEAYSGESFALLERTFARDGGVKGAMLEARTGVRGGMRYILDALTEQFKKEEREKEVNRVLLEALDPLDWDSQVAVIKALMERLWVHLPEDITSQPPERYANYVQLLSKAYVESMDHLNHTFQML